QGDALETATKHLGGANGGRFLGVTFAFSNDASRVAPRAASCGGQRQSPWRSRGRQPGTIASMISAPIVIASLAAFAALVLTLIEPWLSELHTRRHARK
ncbi:MAG TPA: hypothetical protein VJT73_17950, partial [Polyangiaceae bacterium]|nr:hypothetical protein [Polyangiaceae bacterium]